MWRYGIGETPPKKRKHDNDAEKKEKDKQYEAKRVRSNIQSWLAGRSWLRYDKNSKKMFCDYCIKNRVGKMPAFMSKVHAGGIYRYLLAFTGIYRRLLEFIGVY